MKKELNKVAKDINKFLNLYLKKQIKTSLISPMRYGLFPGGKKIRSKILMDVGKICNVNYKTLIKVGAAIECIHAYSLIHDDLPCMDNDDIRRGKLSTHKKYGEATASNISSLTSFAKIFNSDCLSFFTSEGKFTLSKY